MKLLLGLLRGHLPIGMAKKFDKFVSIKLRLSKNWGKNNMSKEEELRKKIATLTGEYYHAVLKKTDQYNPGDAISYGGRVFDEKELLNLVDSSLDFWLTTGRYAERFEAELAAFLGVKYSILTNSGSSANLLAFMSLTSPLLRERQIKRGDEIITVAAGFPTTVAPAIQYGAVPVFVDVSIPTYNIDTTRLEEALSEKTKAVMVAHTMGNPFDLGAVKDFCDRKNLWLIEDNCDALGAKYEYQGEFRYTGTIGDIGTSSFYPPHHMTMGEGGALYTDNPKLKKIILSFRDWGRDCWCESGKDNTCNKRFNWKLGELPEGYDHKYTYSHFGYNLKVTDMQAAIGVAQLEKLPGFVEARKANWQRFKDGLKHLEKYLVLPEPTEKSDPSWFGFLLTVKEDAGFTRSEIVNHLESRNIQTRMLFAGNLIKHPCFDELRNKGEGFRVIGSLENTDRIMMQSFWLGVFPGMNEAKIDYMIKEINDFIAMV